MWDHLVCQPPPHPPRYSSYHLAACPLCPSCPSPLLLPVWVNVSSLTPWLSDFPIVQFSGSSAYSLFLNLLLSFFWLCKEAKCIYLCFHIGQKSLHLYVKTNFNGLYLSICLKVLHCLRKTEGNPLARQDLEMHILYKPCLMCSPFCHSKFH